MAVTVLVPASMQTLTNGEPRVTVEGHNLRAVIADIAKQHPALGDRLQNGDRLGKGLSLAINGDILSTGLITPVDDGAEIAILPQISGGSDDVFTVRQLVHMYRSGDLQLPRLQRKYVWNTKQVCSLLDSLYRNYPSGSMLRWQAPKDRSTRRAAVSVGPSGSPSYMLLDGQQRLTALYTVLHGDSVTVKGRKSIEILFNMDHDDHSNGEMTETAVDMAEDRNDDDVSHAGHIAFAPATGALRRNPNWVSVTEILQSKRVDAVLSGLGMNSRQDPTRNKFLVRLKQLRQILDYRYQVVTIDQSRTYDDVVEIFVRVNSHGTRLSAADLALAQISTIREAAVDKVEGIEEHYAQHGYNFNTSIILRALTIFADNLRRCRFDRLNTLSARQIENGLDLTETYLDASLDFMRNDLGIDRSALLASNFVPLVIAAYLWKLNRKPRKPEQEQLRKWALLALSWGRYSGSGVPMLEEDIREVRLEHGLDGLMMRLRQSRGSIKVTPEDLTNRDMQNPMFKTMLLAFRSNDIEDWLDGGKVSWESIGVSQKPNIHHIFPRSMFKNSGRKSAEINDIANLVFINAGSNQKLSDRHPSDYLIRVDPQELRKQCVPQDPRLWQDDAYDDFLEERRKLLARRLNQFLKVTRDA